jgi:hypothetical protein
VGRRAAEIRPRREAVGGRWQQAAEDEDGEGDASSDEGGEGPPPGLPLVKSGAADEEGGGQFFGHTSIQQIEPNDYEVLLYDAVWKRHNK